MEGIVLQIAMVIFAGGASWGGVKVALNGTRKQVQDIHTDVKALRDDVTHVRERVARLEGRIELE